MIMIDWIKNMINIRETLKKEREEYLARLTRVEISDIVETIEVVAYPKLTKRDVRTEETFPLLDLDLLLETFNPRKNAEEEKQSKTGDYFRPKEAYHGYKLSAVYTASYIAQAKLSLPELYGNNTISLTFGLPQVRNFDSNYSWVLKLEKDGKKYCSLSPKKVIAGIIADAPLLSSDDKIVAEEMNKLLIEQIELYFIGPRENKDSGIVLLRETKIRTLFYAAKKVANIQYQRVLKEGINPNSIKPVLYSFSVSQDGFNVALK